MAVGTSRDTLIGDVQQHSLIQDQGCWRWSFGWTGINNKLHPVMYGSFLNSSAQSPIQQLGLGDIRRKTVQDPAGLRWNLPG